MKTLLYSIATSSLVSGLAFAEETISYLNYIRQFQGSSVQYDASDGVASFGEDRDSALEINPGGARFELWTFKSSSVSGLTPYLLDSAYVGTYIPVADLQIISDDKASAVLRTRADQPFTVVTNVKDLLSGATDPEAAKSVKFLCRVQSYGEKGTGADLDRTEAEEFPLTLPAPMPKGIINQNGEVVLKFDETHDEIPDTKDLAKVRGEYTFTVMTQKDDRPGYHADETKLVSKTIQIWPVANGEILGVPTDKPIRFSLPTLTLNLEDLYPDSKTYAQVYKGEQKLGTKGEQVPGSVFIVKDSVPQNKVLTLNDYGSVLDSNGRWTMELVTVTPFGVERLSWVSFDVERTIKVSAGITTIDSKPAAETE